MNNYIKCSMLFTKKSVSTEMQLINKPIIPILIGVHHLLLV